MTLQTADDESSLLRRVAAKDRKAFETLYSLYYRRLFSYIFKLTRRAELVEEALNDVMLVVWTKAASFDGRSRLSTWIFGIAYHKALKALAHRPPETAASQAAPEREPSEPVASEGPESLIVRRELASTVGKALAALSPEQRAVVELTYYYELSYQEIAEIVDCPVNTVKTRMFHARRRLRQILPEMGVSSHVG
ncbi:MAG TPA: sigma-70 family RNA polymerase sigma factor [Thermoanaerobaculia bacterium]|nr:sigma-70 family RNA polymerase sigma factor [Thermoanaerobaculia bacterium]